MASKEDAIFCKVAVKNNLLTVEQCKECERVRNEEGGNKSLVQIFMERGYVSAKMADIIFKAVERIKTRIEKQKPTATVNGTTSESSYDFLESETAYNLTPLVTGETIHPEPVKDGDTDVALPKVIGTETFYKGLSEEQRKELEKLNLPAEMKGGVVYNVNVQNLADKKETLPAPIDPTALTLHRGELTEAQLLALVKGERITLSAKTIPAPVQHLMTGQETIVAALQRNVVLSMLAVALLVAMMGLGAFAIFFAAQRPADPVRDAGNSEKSVIKSKETLRDLDFTELAVIIESKSPTSRLEAVRELARRAKDMREERSLPYLVERLNDDSEMVRDESRYGLLDLRKKPENEPLVRSSWGHLRVAYGGSAATPALKKTCLDLLVALGDDRLLEVLARAVKDGDLGVRTDGMKYLAARNEPEVVDIMITTLADPDAGIVQSALNYIWEKRPPSSSGEVFAGLLAVGKLDVASLRNVVVFLTPRKVDAYMPAYAELVKSHGDAGIKIASIAALKVFGAAADSVVNAPFDAAMKALGVDANFRNLMLDACKAIRGENSDRVIFNHFANDPDPTRKKDARDTLKISGTPWGKENIALLEKQEHDAKVAAKVNEINIALNMLEQKNWVPGFPAVDKIFKETDKALLNEALALTQYKNESEFVGKINYYHRLAGHVMLSNGQWVDPGPEWDKIKADVEASKRAKDYPAAIAKLNAVDVVLLQNPDIARDVTAKRNEVIEHGRAEVVSDRAEAERLIKEKEFPKAKQLIERMKAIYTEAVFNGESNYWVADAPGKLDIKWETEEREDRSWLLRQVTSRTTDAMLQSQIGVTFGNYGNFEIIYRGDNLFYHFNPGKKMIANTYGAGINFIIPGGAKKISDFRSLSFFFHVDSAWDATVTVTMDCGQNGSYKFERQAALTGDYITINRSDWVSDRRPNVVSDNPFQVVHSVGIQVTLKTKDGKAVQDDTFFEINSVQFVK